MHTHGTMGSSPEVLSWTSCPSLLVGKLKEELKLSVVGDAMKKSSQHNQAPQQPPPISNPPPQIITDLAPPTHLPVPLPVTPLGDEDGVSPQNIALSVDSTRSDGGHFENSVLQLQEHEEVSPGSCEHGGGVSGSEEQPGEGECPAHQQQQRAGRQAAAPTP